MPASVPHIPALLAPQAGLHAERFAMSVNDREPLTYLTWWRRTAAVARFLDHPDVDDVAAFGVPDALEGEILIAAVVPKRGTSPPEDDLFEALRAELALFKVPSRIMMVGALPRNAGGKVDRAELREVYAMRYQDAPRRV